MSRLIDTMDFDELSTFIDYLASAEADLDEPEMRQELEKLFAPEPHWSDSLDAEDNQTWVLCFVSDESLDISVNAEWVFHVNDQGYRSLQYRWKYATPIDFNLRYNRGGK